MRSGTRPPIACLITSEPLRREPATDALSGAGRGDSRTAGRGTVHPEHADRVIKSLVASATAFRCAARGKRAVHTARSGALVNEKWMNLCREFGPDLVGLSTGDASVNRDAPILCCTAEVSRHRAPRRQCRTVRRCGDGRVPLLRGTAIVVRAWQRCRCSRCRRHGSC